MRPFKHLFLLPVTFLLLFSIGNQGPDRPGKAAEPSMGKLNEGLDEQVNPGLPLSYSVIPGINSTWGYNIYSEGQLVIHQDCRPGQPGNEGFRTREDAGKVAERVIEKMINGYWPPTIETEELKQLEAI
jgi:hypothetical protein